MPDPMSGAFHHSGQLNCFVIVDKSAVVVEWKSLPGELPMAAKNEQIRDQIVLLACRSRSILSTRSSASLFSRS